jgi:hypothetical protein
MVCLKWSCQKGAELLGAAFCGFQQSFIQTWCVFELQKPQVVFDGVFWNGAVKKEQNLCEQLFVNFSNQAMTIHFLITICVVLDYKRKEVIKNGKSSCIVIRRLRLGYRSIFGKV